MTPSVNEWQKAEDKKQKWLYCRLLLLAIGTALSAGCSATGPLYHFGDTSSPTVNWRAALPLGYYNVTGIEPVRVPVHPDDSSFLTGSTLVAAKGGIGVGFTLGVETLFKVRKTVWKGGVDLLAGPLVRDGHFGKNRLYSPPISRYRRQESDTRPSSSSSFVYDKITPQIPGIRPFVGFEREVAIWALRAELGVPFTSWKREWGHHRFNKEERIGSETSSVWGVRPAIGLMHSDMGMGCELAYKEYRSGFGKISAVTLCFFLNMP